MAIIHKATLSPSKLELLQAYLANDANLGKQATGDLAAVGAYRFDDPAGQVGIESHILRSPDGALLHLPLVYRNERWDGADQWSVGTMQHSVLGERWVYEASIDPIYVRELVRTIVQGGTGVDEMVETDDGPVARDPSVRVVGSGSAGAGLPTIDDLVVERLQATTSIRCGDLEVVVQNVLAPAASSGLDLRGTWSGQSEPMGLAHIAS